MKQVGVRKCSEYHESHYHNSQVNPRIHIRNQANMCSGPQQDTDRQRQSRSIDSYLFLLSCWHRSFPMCFVQTRQILGLLRSFSRAYRFGFYVIFHNMNHRFLPMIPPVHSQFCAFRLLVQCSKDLSLCNIMGCRRSQSVFCF